MTPEDVMQIIQMERLVGVVVAFGGQTAIKLTQYLDHHGIRILGTSAESIDIAEDCVRFDKLLEQFGIRRPRGMGVNTLEEAVSAAEELGYPVLLRPSYVIGGQNMSISRSKAQTVAYMEKILSGGIENPVLIDQYLPGIELEVDVISDGQDVLMEKHSPVERALVRLWPLPLKWAFAHQKKKLLFNCRAAIFL